MRMPSLLSSIAASASRLISTTASGCMTSSRIRSTSVVPPAMNAVAVSPPASTARASSAARTYLKGCMTLTSPRRADGRDDVGVRTAATEVAAHVLADLVIGVRAVLRQQRDRAHDLTGRAEAALEGIVLDERGLHR